MLHDDDDDDDDDDVNASQWHPARQAVTQIYQEIACCGS